MTRLDVLCVTLGLSESRTKSKNLILEGKISVNGKIVTKPSELVDENASVSASLSEETYVSRGAFKLKHALSQFGVDVASKISVDIGASTGGFTEILLNYGASKIYAVDVGTNQLHPKIKQSPFVVSMEKTNARELKKEDFSEEIDLVVMDVSFISQTLIYPAVSRILKKDGIFVSLVKPQFEVGKENIGKGGIVKNEKLYISLKDKIQVEALKNNLELLGYIPSPIEGGDGNKEFLAYFINKGERTIDEFN